MANRDTGMYCQQNLQGQSGEENKPTTPQKYIVHTSYMMKRWTGVYLDMYLKIVNGDSAVKKIGLEGL